MVILKELFGKISGIDGITIINLQGEILFSVKLNNKFYGDNDGSDMIGKYFSDIYENLPINESTIYKAMEYGMPIYIENQFIKSRGKKGIYISSLSIPIKHGSRVVGAIDLSSLFSNEEAEPGKISVGDNDNLQFNIKKGKSFSTESKVDYTLDDLVAVDPAMINVKKYIPVVASCDLPVMIHGETGTGKEITAQAIHSESVRRDKPFIVQNCAAIPENLLESILFGTSKGAFTGAVDNVGLLELADGGTLFLDEINSMPMSLQPKLLRVLQDGTFRRLGAKQLTHIDVKIITALNVPPVIAMEQGQIRSDIYYRLSMMSINIPPLRERVKDIPAFVEIYVKKHNHTFKKEIKFVSKTLMDQLIQYPWPGNIRELEQAIIYGMSQVEQNRKTLRWGDVKEHLTKNLQITPNRVTVEGSLKNSLEACERGLIESSLKLSSNNVTKAAQILDIPRQTLQRKIKKHNLETLTP